MARRAFGLHKVGKYWHADFWVPKTTIHIHRSTGSTVEKTALDIAQKWHDQAKRKAEGLPVDTEILVKDLWTRWWEGTALTLAESHRDRVERDWRLHILPRFGEEMAKTITTEQVEEFRTSYLAAPSLRRPKSIKGKDGKLKPGKADTRTISSSNKLLIHFHLVFAWAVEVPELLAKVPFKVKVLDTQEKPKATLTKKMVPAFLAEVDKARNPHVHVAVRAMLYLSLREKEALTMRWEWFSPDLKTFQHGERKSKDAPRFPVPMDLREKLMGLCPAPAGKKWERPESGLVLPQADVDEDGEEVRHVGQFTKKTITRAGKTLRLHITPHSMRHSWATMTARATGNAHLIKDGLGQKTLNTAMKYVKLDTKDMADAQQKVFGDLAEKTSPHSHKFARKYSAIMRKKTS